MRIRWCTALLIGLLVSPALAGIVVSFDPPTQPWGAGGNASVDIVASIPEADAIIGWGLDLGLSGNPAVLTGPPVIGGQFDAAYAPDGDGLAGLVPPPGTVWGTGIVLASLTLHTPTPSPYDVTYLDASYTLADLTEGLMTENGFAAVQFVQGTITPEPASLALLAVLGLLRRR
jgi:hypothetical protein